VAATERLTPQARILLDPIGALEHMFGFEPWSLQAEMLRSVWAHPRTAARSGNGPGKTAIAFGGIAPAFLMAHTNSVVVTTAPTWRQVKQLGWREFRRSWGVMRRRMATQPELREVPIPACLTTSVELGEQWHAFGMSTNEPESFAGIHAENVLLIVDEASGVDERIFDAGEGFLTTEGSRVLLVGNPTKPAGQFYRAFTSEKASWNTIHISAFDTPNFTGERVDPSIAAKLVKPEWVEDKQRRWGEDSPLYHVRVLGNFPEQTDDTIISLVSVENAQQRGALVDLSAPLVTISCDVARFGSDETVIMRKRGSTCEIVEVYHGRDLMETAGKCVRYARSALAEEKVLHVRIVIDDDGVGGGVTDRLKETLNAELESDRADLVPYRGAERPADTEHFTNKRAEAWFRAKWLMDSLSIPNDDDLAADLVSVTYKINSNGQIQAERKEDVKKRLGRSPDRGDALVMLLEPARESAIVDLAEHASDGPSAYKEEW
jgi:phage terminase large subunit